MRTHSSDRKTAGKSADRPAEPASGDDKYRSDAVPVFKSKAEQEAFKAAMLDEWELIAKLGHLKPARSVESDRP